MRGLKLKVCKLIPYMPYQKCTNIGCATLGGCNYVSPSKFEAFITDKDRLKMLKNFEKYKCNVIKHNNLKKEKLIGESIIRESSLALIANVSSDVLE